jgi:hypothetical protein
LAGPRNGARSIRWIAWTRIEGVAGLEKEVAELREALGEEPHDDRRTRPGFCAIAGLKPPVSAVDILDILYFVESLYLL